MFKVKRIDNNQIYIVLDTHFDETLQQTYFLIWENRWCWRPANKYEWYKEKSQEELIKEFFK